MISVSATLNGSDVTIIDVDVNGHSVYITYVDSSSDMKVYKTYFDGTTSASNIIATNAAIL